MSHDRHNTLVTWTTKKGVQQARNTPVDTEDRGLMGTGFRSAELDSAHNLYTPHSSL